MACRDRIDIQAISHRLHSSKLEYLGIVTAARGLCQELSAQHRVEIDFKHANIPPNLSKEVSLCLFRVLQRHCRMRSNIAVCAISRPNPRHLGRDSPDRERLRNRI